MGGLLFKVSLGKKCMRPLSQSIAGCSGRCLSFQVSFGNLNSSAGESMWVCVDHGFRPAQVKNLVRSHLKAGA
jgi:hypothetical protein